MAIQLGDKVLVEKGCKALGITKGSTAQIKNIIELGGDYSHTVEVTLYFLNSFMSGKTVRLYARHVNRLYDETTNLNNGDPTKKIVIRRK